MDKNPGEKRRYRDNLSKNLQESETHLFKSTRKKLGKDSGSEGRGELDTGDLDKESRKKVRPQRWYNRAKKPFKEQPYLSTLVTFLGTVILGVSGMVYAHGERLAVAETELGVLKGQLSVLQGSYQNDPTLLREIELLKERIGTIENRLNFSDFFRGMLP